MRKFIDIITEGQQQEPRWPDQHRDYGRMVGKSAMGSAVYDREVSDKRGNPMIMRSIFHNNGSVEHSVRNKGYDGMDATKVTADEVAKKLHPDYHNVDASGRSLGRTLAQDDKSKHQNLIGGW